VINNITTAHPYGKLSENGALKEKDCNSP